MLPAGAGLSSSAALEVALCLALIDLGARAAQSPTSPPTRIELAPPVRACRESTGSARRPACSTSSPRSTARPTAALLHRLPHARTSSPCRCARRLAARRARLRRAPPARQLRLQRAPRRVRASVPAARRRVAARRRRRGRRAPARAAAPARRARDRGKPARARGRRRPATQTIFPRSASLLNASHASLRDLYEVSTAAVEATRAAAARRRRARRAPDRRRLRRQRARAVRARRQSARRRAHGAPRPGRAPCRARVRPQGSSPAAHWV